MLVARALSLALSSLSCLICNAHTPCVPSSAKSICWLSRTFLKLFFTKHFVVVLPPQNLPVPPPLDVLQAALAKPLASCFMHAVALVRAFCFCFSFSFSKPTLYTFITLAFMGVSVCVSVFGAYVCIISAAIRAASSLCFLLSFHFARLPFHVSFSCSCFTSSTLYTVFSVFFFVWLAAL